MYLLIMTNVGAILLVNVTKNVISSSNVDYQINKIASARGVVKADYGIFVSNRIKFMENNIRVVPAKIQNDSTAINIDNIHTLVKAEHIDQNTPEPFILKLSHLHHK